MSGPPLGDVRGPDKDLLTTLDEALVPVGLRLHTAEPRTAGQLSMELLDADGRTCAGVWDRDAAVTRRMATQLAERSEHELVELLADGHLLVQRAGVDRQLVSLRELVRQPGAELVSHRPERRAVVRLDGRCYATVVRPGRTSPVVGPLSQLARADVRLPCVLEADPERGIVLLSAVPGPTLIECLADPASDDRALARDVGRLGAALRAFHGQSPSVTRLVHDRAAEAAGVRRWLDAATGHGLLQDRSWQALLERVCSAIAEQPAELAVLYRDLNDQRVVLHPDGPIGLLGLEHVAYGDPALDLASLLVHLDLRALLGVCTPERAAVCAAALLEGYLPDPELSGRLAGYAGLARLRLAAVHSFRRTSTRLVDEMLQEMHAGPKSWVWQSWRDER